MFAVILSYPLIYIGFACGCATITISKEQQFFHERSLANLVVFSSVL